MSAFGSAVSQYYIHFFTTHYLQSGNQNFNMVNYAQQKIKQQGIPKLQTSISKQQRKEYLQHLNSLMGRGPAISNQAEIDKLYTQAEELVLGVYKNAVTADRVSGKIDYTIQKDQRFSIVQSEGAIPLPRVESFISNFQKIIDNIKQDANNPTSSNVFKDDIKQMEKLAKEISTAFLKTETLTTTKLLQKNGEEMRSQYRQYSQYFKNESAEWLSLTSAQSDRIKKFNELMMKYDAAKAPVRILQGTNFENLIALAGQMALGKGLDEISDSMTDILSNTVVGGNLESAKFELDGLSQNLINRLQALTPQKAKIENGSILVMNDYSQGKIDVEITYNTPKYKKVNPLRISAKNIQDIKNIHAVSNTSLWPLLNGEDPAFVYKFLNVYARRSGMLKQLASKELQSEERSNLKKLSAYKAESFKGFQLLTVYKALTGDIMGRMPANTFIINDNTNNKLYWIDMADIFTVVLNDIQSEVNKYFSISGFKENSSFLTKWSTAGPEERIWDTLSQLRRRKIGVIFKGLPQMSSQFLSLDSTGKFGGNI